jgi:membrane fusion protein (multidrug efflux system)
MKRVFMLMSSLAVLCQVACHEKKEEKEEDVKFTATSPAEIDTSFTKEYVSQIKSVRNIELRALEKGYLEQILSMKGRPFAKDSCYFVLCRGCTKQN